MKKTKILTLAVASVMAFSAVALASCGGGGGTDDPGKDNPGTTASVSLKDTSIQSKIIAAYSFDNGGEAVNPYTGETISGLDVRITAEEGVVAEGVDGSSAISSGDASIKLPKLGDKISEETGVSFTYLNYGKSADGGYSDWNVLLSSDYLSLNYGNITFVGGSAYPSICSELGYGAYAASALEEAKLAGLDKNALSSNKGDNHYYGFNAGCVEANGNVDSNYRAQALYDEMVDTWQVMTVVVTVDNVSFYRNGSLAYRYASSIFEGTTGMNGKFFLADLIDYEEEGDSALYMFNGAGGIADNLVIGQGLSAKEVLALYNDMAPSVGLTTKTAEEAILLDPDDSVKIDTDGKAFAAAIEKRKAALASTFDAEVAKVEALATVGNEDASTPWWSAFQAIKFAEGSKSLTVTYLQKTAEGANWHGTSTILYTGDAAEEGVFRTDNYGWKGLVGGDAWAYTSETDFNFDIMKNVVSCATISETLTINDDGTVTLKYVVKPMDAGKTYEGTASAKLSDGSTYEASASFTVAEEYFVEYTISGITDTSTLYMSFVLEAAYDVIISVDGGILG